MTQYHVRIQENGVTITPAGTPSFTPQVELSVEADNTEAAMKLAIREANIKRAALVLVTANDGHEFEMFGGVRLEYDGTITHSQTKESNPLVKIPGIFKKDDLN